MYPQTNPNTPASGGVYIPYFYQWGLYLQTAHTIPTTPGRPEDTATSQTSFVWLVILPCWTPQVKTSSQAAQSVRFWSDGLLTDTDTSLKPGLSQFGFWQKGFTTGLLP